MKNKILGLNFVLFGVTLIAMFILVCTIIGEGYNGNAVPKDIYHLCIGAMIGVMYTWANMYAICKKEKL